MTTDEELKQIVEELKKSGKLSDDSRIEQMLREGWNTAIRVEENRMWVYSLNGDKLMMSEIGRQTTVEEIEKRIKDAHYGLPHQLGEDYKIEGNTIYIRYGADGIDKLLGE